MKTDLTTTPGILQKFFEPENPQHFINLVSKPIREAILNVPPELLQISEKELVTRAFGPDGEIGEVDAQIRLAFWEEYNSCFEKARPMNHMRIIKGVCSEQNFLQKFLTVPERVAYMITEPALTVNRLKYGFHLAVNELLKTLNRKEEINIKTGCTDTKLIELKVKIFEYLDQRLHGSIVQRTEQKNLNVNVEAQPEQVGLPATTEEIDKRLKQLEEELSLPPAQNPIRILTPMDKVSLEDGNVEHAEFKLKPKVVYD